VASTSRCTVRDPVAALGAAGFTVTALRRFRFPDVPLTQPATPHVLGLAHRPH
jgi:hypothetical protein